MECNIIREYKNGRVINVITNKRKRKEQDSERSTVESKGSYKKNPKEKIEHRKEVKSIGIQTEENINEQKRKLEDKLKEAEEKIQKLEKETKEQRLQRGLLENQIMLMH